MQRLRAHERMSNAEEFVDLVLRNEINRALLLRCPSLGLPDWWLTGGAVFQTVWNVLDGRDPMAGIRDYDLFCFDAGDTSWEAENGVVSRIRRAFEDLDVDIEVRNQARVHLWYEQRFGAPAIPFESSRDAIDHFASTTSCFGLTRNSEGAIQVYAPHGYTDLFARRVRPNPVLAPRDVYDCKTARWAAEWPDLEVEPWPGETA